MHKLTRFVPFEDQQMLSMPLIIQFIALYLSPHLPCSLSLSLPLSLEDIPQRTVGLAFLSSSHIKI